MTEIQVYEGDGVPPRATVRCVSVRFGEKVSWTESRGRNRFTLTLTYTEGSRDRDKDRAQLRAWAENSITLPALDIFGRVENPVVNKAAIGVAFTNVQIQSVTPGYMVLDISIEADEVVFEIEKVRAR